MVSQESIPPGNCLEKAGGQSQELDGGLIGIEVFVMEFGVVTGQAGEHSTECVVGRDTVGQLQELLEPIQLRLPELFDSDPPVGWITPDRPSQANLDAIALSFDQFSVAPRVACELPYFGRMPWLPLR